MRSTISVEDVSTAILTRLQAECPFPIGDSHAPRIPGTKTEIDPPYAVLYDLSGGDFGGSLRDNQEDVILIYQITSVGATAQQARVVRDLTRAQMKKEFLSIPGRRVMDVRLVNPNGGTLRDDDLPNPLFYAYHRYEVDTTAS